MKLSKKNLRKLILKEMSRLNEISAMAYGQAMGAPEALENAKEFNMMIDGIMSQFGPLQESIIELLNSKFMDERDSNNLLRNKAIDDGSDRNIMKKDFKKMETILNTMQKMKAAIAQYEVSEEEIQLIQSQIDAAEELNIFGRRDGRRD